MTEDSHDIFETSVKELPEGLDWFEHRLQEAVAGGGANFRDPIDWQKYGPLFLELYKTAVFQCSFYPMDESPLAGKVKEVEAQFKWDVRR